jgi:hypothetical protein
MVRGDFWLAPCVLRSPHARSRRDVLSLEEMTCVIRLPHLVLSILFEEILLCRKSSLAVLSLRAKEIVHFGFSWWGVDATPSGKAERDLFSALCVNNTLT